MDVLRKRIDVALGKEPADLVITGASVFNTFTGGFPIRDVLVSGGRIAAVLPAGEEHRGETVIDGAGCYLIPGFIDAHVHMESGMVAPEEFASVAARCGVTTMIADPHEIANIFGAGGIRYMLNATEGAAARILLMLPSCVPASSLEEAAQTLRAADLVPFLGHPRVLGLGEMMNYPGVFHGDAEVLAKLHMVREYSEAAFGSLQGLSIDGHAPFVTGRELQAYAAAGIRSDHEASTLAEAEERLAAGMGLMLRQGSAVKNLLDLVPAVTPHTVGSCMLCTDDRQPVDLMREGGLNHLVKLLCDDGRLSLPDILRLASWNPARFFSLRETGALAPGFRADFALYPDLSSWKPTHVWCEGRMTVKSGVPVDSPRPAGRSGDDKLRNSVHLADGLGPDSLAVADTGAPVKVIGLIPGQLITEKLEMRLPVSGNSLTADAERDVAKLAVFERHRKTGRMGLGFVKGFGLSHGAIASTVAHDSHNLIVAGMDDASMLAAVKALRDVGGGLAVAEGEDMVSVLPLPLGGLFSDAPLESVATDLYALDDAVRRLGIPLGQEPFSILSFLSLAVIPRLKLTDGGLVDVDAFALTSLYA